MGSGLNGHRVETLEDREAGPQGRSEKLEHVGKLTDESTRPLHGYDIDDDPGQDGQGGEGTDAPEQIAGQEDEHTPENRHHQIEEQGFGRTHRKVGLIDLGFDDGQKPATSGRLGHGVDGPLKEG